MLEEAEKMEVELCDKLESSQGFAQYATNSCKQMLLYYIEDQLDNARFLWRRTREAHDHAPQLRAAWDVGKLLWKRTNIPEAIRLLLESPWDDDLKSLAQLAATSVRRREISVIGLCYSIIPIKRVKNMLYLSEKDVLQICQQYDWKVDAELAEIHPAALQDDQLHHTAQIFDEFAQLDHIASIVTQLTT